MMLIVRNVYDGSIFSFDGDKNNINFQVRSSFPHICDSTDLDENIHDLQHTQAYTVWSSEPVAPPKPQAPNLEMLVQSSNEIDKKQRFAKYLYEHLPTQKRNLLRSLMVACGIEPSHPHYYPIMLTKPSDYASSSAFRDMVNKNLGLDKQSGSRFLEQVDGIISDIERIKNDSVYDPVNETFIQSSNLKDIFKKSENMLAPVKDNILHFGHKLPSDNKEGDVIADMVGASDPFHKLLNAAKFVSGRNSIPLERARYAFVRFEDDPEAAALYTVGLQDTPENRKTLKEVLDAGDLTKNEEAVKTPKKVQAIDESGKSAAEEINSAIASDGIQPITLVGKHSKGTLIARDPRTLHVWLMKPGSGAVSPAAGVADETATQSKREAAFSHVAREWNLGQFCIRSELMNVDGAEWAVLYMLPFDYQNADKWKKADQAFLLRTMEHYRTMGILHKLAVLDYVLGNPDRHAQNIMISRNGEMVMIDHGSAFAGEGFSPGKDDKSFVPFYLRYGTKGFSAMDYEERFKHMPTVSRPTQLMLERWIVGLKEHELSDTIGEFGINPKPCVERLRKIKKLLDLTNLDIDRQINALWLNT